MFMCPWLSLIVSFILHQVWCSSVTDETTNLQIEKDAHSPPKFRVIGPLSNLEEFSKEFQCPSGKKMNPTKKCEMW